MSFTRIKKIGKKEYAYEITTYWDKKKQQPYQKSKYLGLVTDKEKKVYLRKQRRKPEDLIIDFGDSYIINMFLKNEGYMSIFDNVFAMFKDQLTALLSYKLCYSGAMMHAENWHYGNYVKILYKNSDLAGQRISDFFIWLGNERLHRAFFSVYIPKIAHGKRGLIIDGTSLPNQIHMPLSAWGLSGEEIDMQARFLLVADRSTGSPLFFRILPGNIVDVTTLQNTIQELSKFNIHECYAYMDAGFYSEGNIKEMYSHNIDFLTRLPAERILYKELINNEVKNIEARENIVKYGKRGLFIKQKEIDLFGKKAYAHIVLDPQRKAREITRTMICLLEEKEEYNEEEAAYHLLDPGIMVLVSTFAITKEDVVPAYYTRQIAEKLFGFSKDDISLLPLRVHSEEAVRGYLFLQFLALVIFDALKKKLGKDYTVEEALLVMRNLKAKVYENELLISEFNREQKEICKQLNILMPKILGI